MDDNVVAAMAKWPEVPAVFGWLSLSEQGQWRLHPQGQGHQADAHGTLPVGETITSPQIQHFINRNYTCDPRGRWFFQNGPQRVFVRLDAAPYIIQVYPGSHGVVLKTHTQEYISAIDLLLIDETGKLYVQTNLGPGVIAGRDTLALFQYLRSPQDTELAHLPEPAGPDQTVCLTLGSPDGGEPTKICVPFRAQDNANLPHTLGFQRTPQPDR